MHGLVCVRVALLCTQHTHKAATATQHDGTITTNTETSERLCVVPLRPGPVYIQSNTLHTAMQHTSDAYTTHVRSFTTAGNMTQHLHDRRNYPLYVCDSPHSTQHNTNHLQQLYTHKCITTHPLQTSVQHRTNLYCAACLQHLHPLQN
jgi:hypothetical protein